MEDRRQKNCPQAPHRHPTESLTLLRDINRAMRIELQSVVSYTYGEILLAPYLAPVADLLRSLSLQEMHHYHALGELLQSLGCSHAMRTAVGTVPYPLQRDADSHAAVVARRLLCDRQREEAETAACYRRMAERATCEQTRSLLTRLAEEESEHAEALGSMVKRLENC